MTAPRETTSEQRQQHDGDRQHERERTAGTAPVASARGRGGGGSRRSVGQQAVVRRVRAEPCPHAPPPERRFRLCRDTGRPRLPRRSLSGDGRRSHGRGSCDTTLRSPTAVGPVQTGRLRHRRFCPVRDPYPSYFDSIRRIGRRRRRSRRATVGGDRPVDRRHRLDIPGRSRSTFPLLGGVATPRRRHYDRSAIGARIRRRVGRRGSGGRRDDNDVGSRRTGLWRWSRGWRVNRYVPLWVDDRFL